MKYILLITICYSLYCISFASDCEKDYYRDPKTGRCTACVTCTGDTVEKSPCGPTTPRKCECGPGLKCTVSATNTCARCEEHIPDNCCKTKDNTKLCYQKLRGS
ncbi:CD30-like protein [Deerpox virus W-1170-84]|uniref:CD30-like protein n=1 Tax=Deerpox virus (strain W-1170-84) TaxID=305676 RepID=Q08FH5_DPV84|nr:CD30-like protein [Deerpox virus W-1170-84]